MKRNNTPDLCAAYRRLAVVAAECGGSFEEFARVLDAPGCAAAEASAFEADQVGRERAARAAAEVLKPPRQ